MSTPRDRVQSHAGLMLFGRGILSCAALLLFFLAPAVSARQISIVVQPPIDSYGRVFIEVTSEPVRRWAFLNSYAGVSELGKRIEDLKAFDAAGAEIAVRKVAPGQFETERFASKFRYSVVLNPPPQASEAARVSWLNVRSGLLMLADLLPVDQREKKSAEDFVVHFKPLPDPWLVYSNERKNSRGDFLVSDVGRAVFALGPLLRISEVSISGMTLRMVIEGQWAFSDSESVKIAEDTLKAHRDVFGSPPSSGATVILFSFPQPIASHRWSAETRGQTVTVLMGKQPSKVGALAQLGIALTHELFHLWVPNGLALEGDYDWFYEGFTMYHAARTAVRLGLLTFTDFLNAIGRAYDGYSAVTDRDRWSLIEASQRRWTVGEPFVYSKAMVIALIYDLNLRYRSKGKKRSLDDVYRRLFREHLSPPVGREGSPKARDGNAVVIGALRGELGAPEFVQRFINEPYTLELQKELAQFGLRVERIGLRTRISVGENLAKQQRDLLRQLGYNDRAR